MIWVKRLQRQHSLKIKIILIFLSLVVGALGFFLSEYKPSTLVIAAKTLTKGTGSVLVSRAEGSGSTVRHFRIIDNRGEDSDYVIELPAGRAQSVTIAPLAPLGLFEIERIILENDEISYIWDDQGACTEKLFSGNILKREICNGSYPAMTTEDDGTIIISSIPEAGTKRTMALRIAFAFGPAMAFFLGGLWLLRPLPAMPFAERIECYSAKVAWLAFIALFLYQFYLICIYSIDVPFYDETSYFLSDALTHTFPLKWVFSSFYEHMIVPTKLMAWLNLELFNLDFRLQKIVNYLIFGGMLASIVVFKNRVLGRDNFRAFPLFLIFLLSPIIWQNHRWAFQSQFHIFLLFSIFALCFVYSREQSYGRMLVFCLVMLGAMYSFSGGTILAIVYMVGSAVFTFTGIARKRIDGIRGLRVLFMMFLILGMGMLAWFHAYGHAERDWTQAPYVYPTDSSFWDYFFNLLSFSFGIETPGISPGVIILPLLLLPAILLLADKESRWQPSVWRVLTAIAGILVLLAIISMTRTNLNMKTSRYVEIGFLLIPFMAMAWWLALNSRRLRVLILSVLWVACAVSYFDDWSPFPYRHTKQDDFNTLECVEKYFHGTGNGICLGVASPRQLDRARELGVKFTRQFAPNRPGNSL